MCCGRMKKGRGCALLRKPVIDGKHSLPPPNMCRLREPTSLPPQVRRIKEAITNDSARWPSGPCRKCGGVCCRAHEHVKRWFYVVHAGQVYPVHCTLTRWKCAGCGASFRHLPPCCLPYKRYLRPEIEARCTRYVEEEASTYRSVIRDGHFAVVYAGAVATSASSESAKKAEAHSYLSRSTVHGWIRFLAEQTENLWRLEERVQQLSGLLQLTWFCIAGRKHRSECRRQILILCRRLLGALRVLRNPPELRTACRSP